MRCTGNWSEQTVIWFHVISLLRFLTLFCVLLGGLDSTESGIYTYSSEQQQCHKTSFHFSMLTIAINVPVRIINFGVENETGKQCADVPGQWTNNNENTWTQSHPMQCTPPQWLKYVFLLIWNKCMG